MALATLALFGGTFENAAAQTRAAPEIRITPSNGVPACATPDRLMAFLQTRNQTLDPRFRDIARWYQKHGEAWRVRWDYAFFQMAIETNFLTYLRPDGRRGDVDPRQNNFAGIGTTGGGVPGDRYPDVSTGVLAQIQHLVVYSGERIEDPVAPRTRLKQDHILTASAPVASRRAMTFQDLSGRWAVDKAYGRSINRIADQFAEAYCGGRYQSPPALTASAAAPQPRAVPKPVPSPWITQVPVPVDARPGAIGRMPPALPNCRVQLASYGGARTVLIRRDGDTYTELTALTVLEGFETSMVASFLEMHARGGVPLASFATRAEAMNKAYQICPNAPR
jgi:hypothetical protein